ncbi:hypothetical protein [Desulfallas thermosapovorans]|uniref:Uncharacterized protein n=1 Tax=Desulfallas thermosapovorans DSM 6562 TaxID=1121431 RepID=A0A5S4ZVT4_9FIRM|nr:hypothetical protein [Desulfallas thermosapovorans]TYO97032.1 hypothetical protein LX24_00845 [Desulfallas thermosapovorans DSM 6562]
MDTCQAVFEKIYQEICGSICHKHEVALAMNMWNDPYPDGLINGLFEALRTVAIYTGVDAETREELWAMEGY